MVVSLFVLSALNNVSVREGFIALLLSVATPLPVPADPAPDGVPLDVPDESASFPS